MPVSIATLPTVTMGYCILMDRPTKGCLRDMKSSISHAGLPNTKTPEIATHLHLMRYRLKTELLTFTSNYNSAIFVV